MISTYSSNRMRMEYSTERGNFSVYPSPEREQFVLVMSRGNEATLLNHFGNPLDAVHAVISMQTGNQDWDYQEEDHLPPSIYDLGAWLGGDTYS